MKLKICFLVGLLVSASSAFSQDTNFWIFLCFGQSNMESGDRMNEADRSVDKRFQVLPDFDNASYGWKKGNWYERGPAIDRARPGHFHR